MAVDLPCKNYLSIPKFTLRGKVLMTIIINVVPPSLPTPPPPPQKKNEKKNHLHIVTRNIAIFKFKHDLLLLWVPEGEHSLQNSQSPLKTNEMAFLKNANIVSTSLRGI
jgi:hypothetical protein